MHTYNIYHDSAIWNRQVSSSKNTMSSIWFAICFVLRNSIYVVVVATLYSRVSKDEKGISGGGTCLV